MSSAEPPLLPDLARIRRMHRRGQLDRVIEIDSVSRWAKREEYDAGAEDVSLSGTTITYEQDSLSYTFVVHFDPAILPGMTVTDGDVEVIIDSVEAIGRRQYMQLHCSARTPATVIE